MKFTPRATNAFRMAEVEARGFRQPCVGSQHLLLGLYLLGSGVQFSILTKLGFTADSLRQSIVALGSIAEQTQTVDGFVFGASAVQSLERASHEAAAMSHTYIGTEHVLLGLLSEQAGGAATLFRDHKANTAMGRQMILDAYAHV